MKKNIISATKMHYAFTADPKAHPFMLLLPAIDKKLLDYYRRTKHVITTEYQGKKYKAMIPNAYKNRPLSQSVRFRKKAKAFKEELSLTETPIFDIIVEREDESALQLYSPETKKKIRERFKRIFLHDTIRYRGKFRSGVVCVFKEKLPPINLKSKEILVLGQIEEY